MISDSVSGTLRIRARVTVDPSGQQLVSENIRESFDLTGLLLMD